MERHYTTPLLDKLGILPGSRVAIIGVEDPEIRGLLAERTADVTEGRPLPETDVVLLAADTEADLEALSSLKVSLRPAGAIWVISRKGPTARIRDVGVMAAARRAGLVDNKVASFSSTHTALRLVIPLVDRAPRSSGTIPS